MMISGLTIGQLLVPGQACAGLWSLQPSLLVAGRFDDNISFTETNELSDFITVLSPAVQVRRIGDQVTFLARYNTDLEFYTHHSDRNNTSHVGQMVFGITDLGPGLLQHAGLNIVDSFTSTKRLVNFPTEGAIVGNEGVITTPSTTLSNTASATFTLPLTDSLSGSASYNRSFVRYDHPSLIDSTTQNITAEFAYQLTSRIVVKPAYNYRVLEFDVQGQQRSIDHELVISINTTIDPSFSFNLRAGGAYLTDTNATQTIGSATLAKRFLYTETVIGYSRLISSGGGVFGEPAVSQLVTIQITRTMGERASSSLSGSYTTNRPRGNTSGHSQLFNVSASVNYRVAQWLTTTTYHHMAQQATADNGITTNVRNNIITLTLNGTWETPPL